LVYIAFYNNIYDIIIVDEAHEHNINMDIIIALSRQTCYFNNSVRLIIVSATMDEDEPIYRRYFYYNNDNLMEPIKMPMKHPFLNIESFLPQPIFMDRRYHISPPGETTQYKIEEKYLDYDPADIITNIKEAANKAQEEGQKKILEICKSTTTGQILFFANGEADIKQVVVFLNENLPPNVIALPFYTKLSTEYKDIIININKEINKIYFQIKNNKYNNNK